MDSQENEKVEKFLNISTYSMYYNHERTRNFLFFRKKTRNTSSYAFQGDSGTRFVATIGLLTTYLPSSSTQLIEP